MSNPKPTARQATIEMMPAIELTRPKPPYNVAEAEHALHLAGYVHAASLAQQEPMAVSWLIPFASKVKYPAHREEAHALDLLWRVLRVAANLSDYSDIIDDDRDPTLRDALKLLLQQRAIHETEIPRMGKALRSIGLEQVAAIAEAATP